MGMADANVGEWEWADANTGDRKGRPYKSTDLVTVVCEKLLIWQNKIVKYNGSYTSIP
jgi:hypothetical protein